MKKFFTILVAMLVMSGMTFANDDASIFSVDKNSIEQELAPLSDLENYVNENAGVTYDEIDNPEVLDKDVVMGDVDLNYGPPLGIPSFLWGFILSWVGILIVYLIAEDGDETKKALWGCLAGAALYIILYFVLLGSLFASASSVSGI